jgi:hypothetical protein
MLGLERWTVNDADCPGACGPIVAGDDDDNDGDVMILAVMVLLLAVVMNCPGVGEPTLKVIVLMVVMMIILVIVA